MMQEIKINRPTLGPFMSVVCFRYLHDASQDIAGNAMIIDAGRQRGHNLIQELHLAGSCKDAETLHSHIASALGPDGTRLCIVQSIKEQDNGGYVIHSTESASPTYTLGVLIGAISAITGKTMIGKEVAITGEEGIEGRTYCIEPL